MLTKYVEIIAAALSLKTVSNKEVVSITRQNDKGVQVLNDVYAGIDANAKYDAYIAFEKQEDAEYKLASRQRTSKRNTFEVTSRLKLIHWHTQKNATEYGQFLLGNLLIHGKDFTVEPISVGTDSEEIFKAETKKDEGHRSDLRLLKIVFDVKYDKLLQVCETYKEEGCNGC